MATACLLTGCWDQSKYGPLAFSFTDNTGTYACSITTGIYDHDDIVTSTSATGIDSSLALAVVGAMETLSPARTYTLTLNRSTGLYTWSVDAGTFSVTWTTGKELLGFTGNLSATATHISTKIPWFLIKPTIGGLSADTAVFRESDAIKSSTASSGGVYRLAPAYVSRLRSWEHQFEPKERCDVDYFNAVGSATHLYTWEQLWLDFGTALLPIGCYVLGTDGHYECFAFSLMNSTFDSKAFKRMRPNDDVRYLIHIDAQLWPGTQPPYFARIVI